ncbi:MAG: allantoinase [Olpidium bornovanus]|uniref:Allantoinase n=1 Tax=Olpidium bornovanus TaxID=278681 RepID=A0A8H8DK60_9FUNG|nr:MAG: allantoinase [Olpidium bornovanus]
METRAISLIVRLAREFPDLRCHIVHLSAGAALDLVREAKRSGIRLTAETCFHYLAFDAEEIPDGATQFKCCPPIRSRANRDLLWGALEDGTIDYVVSDHSPCTADLKIFDQGDFTRAWGGIASVQFGLSVFWTEARKRGATCVTARDITRWLSENAARQVQLVCKKGRLEPGADADFVVWDPEASFTVSKSSIRFRNKITPYEGKQLYGVVHRTFVRGQVVFDADQKSEVEGAVLGQLLL